MSGDLLGQDEIDALLHGVTSGSVDTQPKPVDDPSVARDYDFSTQTRIVRGRMPTLEMINERLARALRMSIFSMLRRTPEISVLGISTPKYSEYVPTLSIPTSLNLIRLTPLSGTALLIFESKLVFAIIDMFFGGSGRHAKIEGRDFTQTENQIIEMLMEHVIAGLKEAWEPVMGIGVEFMSREVNPHFANIVSPTEIVVVSKVKIDFEGRGGEVHITLPYAMIEPIKDTLRAGMQSDRADREERWSQILRNELEECEVDLVTQLGTIQMSVASLLDMRPGDIIPCNFDGKAAVLADNVPLFWGPLGQHAGRRVVKIDQMNMRKMSNMLDVFVKRQS